MDTEATSSPAEGEEGAESCGSKYQKLEQDQDNSKNFSSISETNNDYSSILSKKIASGINLGENVGSPMDTTKDLDNSKDSENSSNLDTLPEVEATKNSSKDKRKIDSIGLLEMDDVLILCDLFYLPYEYGTRAKHLLKHGHWLTSNAATVRNVDKDKIPISERTAEVQEWYEKAIHFHDCFKEVVVMVDKLVNMPNRVLLYDLYNYVSDMRGALSLVNAYVKWNGRYFYYHMNLL